jgi:peptidoglycan/LPS O-acetylase OafA/YrhL
MALPVRYFGPSYHGTTAVVHAGGICRSTKVPALLLKVPAISYAFKTFPQGQEDIVGRWMFAAYESDRMTGFATQCHEMSESATILVERGFTRARGDNFYRPGLDILRALAFLLVFVAHGLAWHIDKPTEIGAIARTGEFGVCIFFFLSSYLITELLLREKRDTGTILIPAFYKRRILRIWPLYFAMIAFGCLYGLFSPNSAVSLAWGISLVLLFTNWYTVGHDYPPGFLFPLWSISLEEQFYLVWPWTVKSFGPGTLLAIASLLLAAAYLTLALLLGQKQSLDPAIWVNSLVQFQFFALGTMTAIGLRGRVPHLAKPVRWGLFLAGLLCMRAAQAAVFANDPSLAQDFAHIAPRFAAALLGCLCLFFSLLPLAGGRMQRPFIYLGKISYGLYVYHVLLLGAAKHLPQHFAGNLSPLAAQLWTMAIALPATILTAMLSYRYLESPFLRFKKRYTIVRSRPV